MPVAHSDEVRILRRRAKAFPARALDSLNAGDYDLAVFLSEQAVQLHLKSILLEEVEDSQNPFNLQPALNSQEDPGP